MKKYSKVLTGVGIGAKLVSVPAVFAYILYFIKFILNEILEQAPKVLFGDFGTKTLDGAKAILANPETYIKQYRIAEADVAGKLSELQTAVDKCEALPGKLDSIGTAAGWVLAVLAGIFVLGAIVFGITALIMGRKDRQLPKWMKWMVVIFVSRVAGMNELHGSKNGALKLLKAKMIGLGIFAFTVLVQNVFVDVSLVHYFCTTFGLKTPAFFDQASLLPGLLMFFVPIISICVAAGVKTKLFYNELSLSAKIFAAILVWPTIGILLLLIPEHESHGARITDTFGDKTLNVITSIILISVVIIVGYPILYVISSAFTSSQALSDGRVVIWPVDTGLEAFKFVMDYKAVWSGFKMSIFYTVCDVILQMTMTILVAYPLSRKSFQGRSMYTMIFYMSTRVSAGLIPGFILKCNLGLFDNIWAVLISGSVSVSHILILRTCFQTAIPGELFDSAMIDGASHFKCVTKIALPLAKATLSVLILYCIVGQWNEYFTSMLYLRDAKLYPLQLVLRPIMQAATAVGQMDTASMSAANQAQANSGLENVRYALIVISSAPVIAAYFVVQKYFKGGVMLGSVKG